MLTLLTPLQREQDQSGGKLILWLCEMGDERYSFRDALAELERALGTASVSATHTLPAEYPMEDFVEGQFCCGGREFAIYYERSLGYLQFSSPSVSEVEALEVLIRCATRFYATSNA